MSDNCCSLHRPRSLTSYCKLHDVNLCMDCLLEEHRECIKHVEPIETTRERISDTADDILRKCKTLTRTMNQWHYKGDAAISQITNDETQLVLGIKQMRLKLIEKINTLATEALELVTSVLGERKDSMVKGAALLSVLLQRCSDIDKETRKCRISQGAGMQLQSFQHEIDNVEKMLDEGSFEFGQINIHFYVSPMLSQIRHKFTSFGELAFEDVADKGRRVSRVYLTPTALSSGSSPEVDGSDCDEDNDMQEKLQENQKYEKRSSLFVYDEKKPVNDLYDILPEENASSVPPHSSALNEHEALTASVEQESEVVLRKRTNKEDNKITFLSNIEAPVLDEAFDRTDPEESVSHFHHCDDVEVKVRKPAAKRIIDREKKRRYQDDKIVNLAAGKGKFFYEPNTEPKTLPKLPTKDPAKVKQPTLKVDSDAATNPPNFRPTPTVRRSKSAQMDKGLSDDTMHEDVTADVPKISITSESGLDVNDASSGGHDSDASRLLPRPHKPFTVSGTTLQSKHARASSSSCESGRDSGVVVTQELSDSSGILKTYPTLRVHTYDGLGMKRRSEESTAAEIRAEFGRSLSTTGKAVSSGDLCRHPVDLNERVSVTCQRGDFNRLSRPNDSRDFANTVRFEDNPISRDKKRANNILETKYTTIFGFPTEKRNLKDQIHLQDTENKNCLVTGLVVTKNKCLVVCDYKNNRIQIFDMTGCFLDSYTIKRPYGCCLIRDDKFAITSRERQSVCVFNVTDSKLVFDAEKMLGADVEVFGISYSFGFFCVSCCNQVQILSENLQLYKTVRAQKQKRSSILTTKKAFITKSALTDVRQTAVDWSSDALYIYAADLGRERVLCVDSNGDVKWKVSINNLKSIALLQDTLYVAALKRVTLVAAKTGDILGNIHGGVPKTIFSIAIDPDSEIMLMSNETSHKKLSRQINSASIHNH